MEQMRQQGVLPVTRALNELLYPQVRKKIQQIGEDVEKFEKQWEELKGQFVTTQP